MPPSSAEAPPRGVSGASRRRGSAGGVAPLSKRREARGAQQGQGEQEQRFERERGPRNEAWKSSRTLPPYLHGTGAARVAHGRVRRLQILAKVASWVLGSTGIMYTAHPPPWSMKYEFVPEGQDGTTTGGTRGSHGEGPERLRGEAMGTGQPRDAPRGRASRRGTRGGHGEGPERLRRAVPGKLINMCGLALFSLAW